VLSPVEGDVAAEIELIVPGGVDATLEMSGHSSALHLAVRCTRPGGRISTLGLYSIPEQTIDMSAVIFKGLRMQGIVGRKLWETWDQMHDLLASGRLVLAPVVTHRMHFTEFQEAMELMKQGKAGKIVFHFDET
jgi:threonine 3-dehydrogenase